MLSADLPQTLQIALRGHNHASGTGEGLNDHGSYVRGIVQSDQHLKLVRHLRTVLWHALGKGGFSAPGVVEQVGL